MNDIRLSVGEPIEPSPNTGLCPPCWAKGIGSPMRAVGDDKAVCVTCQRVYPPTDWLDLTDDEERAVLVALGVDPDLPPRGVAYGTPPPGLRNHVCAVDGHSDPDRTGGCIHCPEVWA